MPNTNIEIYSGSKELIRREKSLSAVVALEAYEEEIRRPKSWFRGDASRMFSRKGSLTTGLGALGLSVIAGFLTTPYPFLGVPSGLFFGSLAALGWTLFTVTATTLKDSRAEEKYLERLGAVALVRDRFTEDVEEWLLKSYGLKFTNENSRIRFGDAALGISPLRWHDLPFRTVGPIEPPKPGLLSTVSLMSTQGAKLTADFYLTEDGSFELRKHTILDTTESPYFTLLREELS